MLDTVRFTQPPLLELMLGVQFSPLSLVTAAHLGWFWRELGESWVDLTDGPALPDQFERFDAQFQGRSPQVGEWRISPASAMNRLAIGHRQQNRLIQIQASQFRFHWRRSQENYPKYSQLMHEFGEHWDQFVEFIQSNRLGSVLPNQWDLTYIDTFSRGEDWQEPEDWQKILPGLFGVPQVADGLTLDSRSASWSYSIAPEVGRLHINAGAQAIPGQANESLVLRLTARGPVHDREDTRLPRASFDLGHDAILKTFLKITSPQMQQKWGRIS